MAAPAAIPPFLTALMVANGANAGNLSPLSAVGIIANTRMASVGLGGHETKVWAANFIAHALVAMIAYAVLVRSVPRRPIVDATVAAAAINRPSVVHDRRDHRLDRCGRRLARAARARRLRRCRRPRCRTRRRRNRRAARHAVGRDRDGLRRDDAGDDGGDEPAGCSCSRTLLATLATPATVNGVIAFVTGAISTASSTSGVVLPTFLPTVPGLVQQVGGGDPLAVALSINVGASLVDVSPLSTIGAICVAAIASADVARDLFRKMLIWGVSMTLVGALLCQLFAGWFARL